METICSILGYIMSDQVTFIFFELLFLLFIVIAVWRNSRFKRSGGSVKRDQKTWNYFYLAYGIASVIMIQIISVSDWGKGYKVIISVANIGLLLYVTFFNGWFRNKIIGVIIKSQEMREGGGVIREEVKVTDKSDNEIEYK